MKYANLLLAVFFLLVVIGCSGGADVPVTPDGPSAIEQLSNRTEEAMVDFSDSARMPLGFFEFIADPNAGTLDFTRLRTAEVHLNGVVFLEGGTEQLLTLAGPPVFSNGGKQLDVNIKITHPLGIVRYTVFDVHGIVLTKGSLGDWDGSDVFIGGPEKTRLMNSDGFTRWWNPKDFKNKGIYGYYPGELGSAIPVFQAATINGYKTFADGLDADSEMSDLDPLNRGMFLVNSNCTRHYTLSLAGGLVFNYAIDASWALPISKPPTPPDDFPPHANMPEPYWIEVEEWVNTLWYNAAEGEDGNVFYYITIHDWQSADSIGAVKVEIPAINVNTTLTDLVEEGPNHKKYDLRLILPNLPSNADLEMLITVESLEGDYQPAVTGVDKPLKAYQMHYTDVSDVAAGNQHPLCDMEATTETTIDVNNTVTFEAIDCYDVDGNITLYQWDFNGDEIYGDTWDSGTETNPTVNFPSVGNFDVRLKVKDNDYDYTVSDPVNVTVIGEPPVAAAEFIEDPPYLMFYGYWVSAATSSDPDGTIELYEWDTNYDGSFEPSVYGEEIEAAWNAEGEYDIMLRVTDNHNQSDFLDEPIHVTVVWSDNHPPVVDEITISRTTCFRGSTTEVVELNVIAHDPDGGDTIDGYQWICDAGYFDDDSIQDPTWYPPNEVIKPVIRCVVRDNHGAQKTGFAPKVRVTSQTTKEPAPAPDYESERLIGTGSFWLHDYTPGKVVLMNFWSTT